MNDRKSKPSIAGPSAPRISHDLLLWLCLGIGIAFTLAGISAFLSGFQQLFYSFVRLSGALLLFCWLVAGVTCVEFARSGISKAIFAVSLLIFLLPGLVVGGLPVTAPDAMIHHLAVPKWWLAAGKPFPIIWHEWSFYPMLLNWAYVGILAGPGIELTAFCHWLLLLPLAAVVGVLCKECSESEEAGLVGSLVTVSLPLFVRLSSVPLVDLGLALFSAIATVFSVRLLRGIGTTWVNVAGAGIAVGCALSSKYNGLLFAAVILLAFCIAGVRSRFKIGRTLLIAGGIFVIAGCIFSPWLIKNYSWTGNPLFPLFKGTLGGPVLTLSGAPKGIPSFIHRMSIYGETVPELIALPVRLFVSGADGDPRRFDGVLSPLLLLGFLPIFFRRKVPELSFLLLLVLGYLFFCIGMSGARVRYLVPMIPALTASLTVLLTKCSATNYWRYTGWSLIILHLILCSYYVGNMAGEPAVKALLEGTLDRERYLRTKIPEYPAIDYVNSKLGHADRVYLISTGNPFFYFDRPVISRGYFSSNEVLSWLRSDLSSGAIKEKFANLGVTHVLVNADRFLELMRPMLTPEQGKVWNQFSEGHLELLFDQRGYSVWRLK